jgi:TRAP-type C4-dicarboxylate transport system permease small subunit
MDDIVKALEDGAQGVQPLIVPALLFAFVIVMTLMAIMQVSPSFKDNHGSKVWAFFAIAAGTPLGLLLIPAVYKLFGGK